MMRSVALPHAAQRLLIHGSRSSVELLAGWEGTMQLQFASLEDRILWHVVRELNQSAGSVGVPNLVQTLSDLGPAAVARVIEQLQEIDD